MKKFKTFVVLLFSVMTMGCAVYVDDYVYGTDVVVTSRSTVHYNHVRYVGSPKMWYVPSHRERHHGRCEVPGYSLMIMSGLCENMWKNDIQSYRNGHTRYHRHEPRYYHHPYNNRPRW